MLLVGRATISRLPDLSRQEGFGMLAERSSDSEKARVTVLRSAGLGEGLGLKRACAARNVFSSA